jgi:cystathionine beta-lyase/cystathionine gamma-synthase
LATHQNYEIVSKQIKDFGGMIAVYIGGIKAEKTLVNNLKVSILAI